MAQVPREVVAWLDGLAGKTVYLITHEAPDGDAIGSLLAAAHLISSFGATAVPLCTHPVPEVYRFLTGAGSIHDTAPSGTTEAPASAHLYVDCGERSRAGQLAKTLGEGVYTVNFDHHTSNDRFGDLNWVEPAASSTGEMLAELYLATGTPFGQARDAIYTAIVTDTGGFAFESTSPATHEAAATLLRAGTRPGELHDLVYNSRDRAALALLGAAIRGLELTAGGRIAHMALGPEDFAAAGAGQEHTDGIVNYARSIRGVDIGLLFYSLEPGLVKVGIRTRPAVAAHEVAQAFGGGGHPRAAGCTLRTGLEDAVEQVLAEARRHLASQ